MTAPTRPQPAGPATPNRPRSLAPYKAMLIGATLIWGSSFVLMKDAVAVLEPATLIGVRFGATAILLTIVFWRHVRACLNRDALIAGGVLGALFFLAYWTQTIGLAYTTPGKNAFLTGTYCAIVPFAYWLVAHRRPRVAAVVAAFICVVGVGFVSLSNETLTIGFGDLMTLVCAFFFAFHIVYVTRFSGRHDVLGLTAFQFWVGGIAGLAIGLPTEPLPSPADITPMLLLNLAFLVIFATCVALVFQNVALKYVPPAQASLFLSLESVFGVAFSVVFYGEVLTFPLVIGFALIFGAILLSELWGTETAAEETAREEMGDKRSNARGFSEEQRSNARELSGKTRSKAERTPAETRSSARRTAEETRSNAREIPATPDEADLLIGDGAAIAEVMATDSTAEEKARMRAEGTETR